MENGEMSLRLKAKVSGYMGRITSLTLFFLHFFLCSCRNNEKWEVVRGALALPVEIGVLSSSVAYDAFAAQALSAEKANSGFGIAVSPYYSLKAADLDVAVYCTPVFRFLPPVTGDHQSFATPPATGDLHSFATVMLNASDFPVMLEVTTLKASMSTCVLLPEKNGATASVTDNKVTAVINRFGSYTFAPEGQPMLPLTVFVEEAVTPAPLPEGVKVKRFAKGLHYVERFEFESDQTLYLEKGAYLMVLPANTLETHTVDANGKKRYGAFIKGASVNNIRLIGDGAYIDFTNLDLAERAPINLSNCQNVLIRGVTIINSPVWNITLRQCEDVVVDNVKIFGYRTSSDGINAVNSKNVAVKNSFIRSGDDLFGVKSMMTDVPDCHNITFSNNVAWPDKVRGFGIMHKTITDISNITFRDCAVLFRCSEWTTETGELYANGSLVVVVGDAGNMSNILFEDIEIYYDVRYPILLSFIKDKYSTHTAYGTIKDVTFRNIKYNTHSNTRVRMNAMLEENLGRIEHIYFDNIIINGAKATSLSDLNLQLTYVDDDKIFLY